MKTRTIRKLWIGLLASTSFAVLFIAVHPTSADQTWSLADDFSYTENSDTSTWSYRLDDFANHHPAFPLLTLTDRNANALWGSTFRDRRRRCGATPRATGELARTSREKSNCRPAMAPDGRRARCCSIPRAETSPSGLVVAWTAPGPMMIDVEIHRRPCRRNAQTDGVGLRITKRIGGVDTEIVATAEHRWPPRPTS